jgi:transposase InsO family protein
VVANQPHAAASRDPWLDPPLLAYLVGHVHDPRADDAERERVTRRAAGYAMVEGTLLRVGRDGTNDVAVPRPEDREDTVITLHYNANHQGMEGTIARLATERYWWPRMRDTVRHVLDRCDACQRAEARRRPEHEGARTWTVMEPGQRWAMDLLSLPPTPDGYVALAVLVDTMSRYPIAEPIRSKTAEEVVGVLQTVMMTYGSFYELQTDNGPEFRSALSREFCRRTGVRQIFVTPSHPHANGLVERVNRMIREVLRRLGPRAAADWPRRMPAIMHALRSRKCETTGFSPFRLMFGRDSTLLGEWDADQPLVATEAERVMSRADGLLQLTQVTWPQARANTARAQAAQRQQQDRRYAIVQPLEPGTQVFVEVGYFDQSLKDRLTDRYTGPYRVVRRLRNGNYVLRGRDGRELARTVPRDKIKRGRMGTDLTDDERRGAELRGSQREVEEPEPAASDQPAGTVESTEQSQMWAWEEVLAARRTSSGEWEYYIRWADMPEDAPDRCQWVREDAFGDVSAVRQYRSLGDLPKDSSVAVQQARRVGTQRW